VWEALSGPQAAVGLRAGGACCYHPDVAPFAALDPAAVAAGGATLAAAWRDLCGLAAPGTPLSVPVDPADEARVCAQLPGGLALEAVGTGVQMIAHGVCGSADPKAEPLGPADVDDMLDLIERSRPGPFRTRTVELGGYVGRRHRGRLVAMAGRRMAPPGFTEISAVTTDPRWRGRGLASALVGHVAGQIRAAGAVPFLHAAAGNTGAIALYQHLGFVVRRQVCFLRLRTPAPTR
jgi:ribosomal protein S18 acetylase RimI-like enzyme